MYFKSWKAFLNNSKFKQAYVTKLETCENTCIIIAIQKAHVDIVVLDLHIIVI